MIRTAQRRFAPTVIGITRNSDRHQIGMSDRHRRNTQAIRTHVSGFRYSDTFAVSFRPTKWVIRPEAACPLASFSTLNANISLISTACAGEFSVLSETSAADLGKVTIGESVITTAIDM